MPRPVVTTETPITVNVSKSQGYIWDASDAIKLRDEHRVLGLAVGSLANHNSQNQVRMNVWLVVERRRMCSGFRWNCPICFAGHSCAYQAYRLAKRMPCNMSATNIKYIYIYLSLPTRPFNNNQQVLGLPVLLSPEELRLLHARGKITMLDEDMW